MKTTHYYEFPTIASNLTVGDYILHTWQDQDYQYTGHFKVLYKTEMHVQVQDYDGRVFCFYKRFISKRSEALKDPFLTDHVEKFKNNATINGYPWCGWLDDKVKRIVYRNKRSVW